MNGECMDKIFAARIFWAFLAPQAMVTGGFLVLAVTTDIIYIYAKDSLGTAFLAFSTIFAVPVACFCFLFGGLAFFNMFRRVDIRKVGFSFASFSSKSTIATLPVLVARMASPLRSTYA